MRSFLTVQSGELGDRQQAILTEIKQRLESQDLRIETTDRMRAQVELHTDEVVKIKEHVEKFCL
jgi:IS1 family transposase